MTTSFLKLRSAYGTDKDRRLAAQRVKAEGISGDLDCYVDILMAGEVDA